MWQVIAIVALLAATAGWTTVAVIALRGPDTGPVAQASPTDSADPDATDEPTAVPGRGHARRPDLELALPTNVNGVDLQVQSVTAIRSPHATTRGARPSRPS